MAETPYYDRSRFFEELVERLEKEDQERRATPADMPADPDNTGGSKSRQLDPKIVEAMKRADQARSQGQGLSLVKSVLDFVRDGGDPSLVRGLVTRRDLEDLGVLTSRADSRRKEREERYKRISEKRAAAQERFQEQRKKLKERNLQKRTEAAERNERSGDFVGPRRPQEGDRRSPETPTAAGGMTFGDVLDVVGDFGSVPPDREPMGLDEMIAEAERTVASARDRLGGDSRRALSKADADREYLLGLDYLDYLTGEGAGTFIGDHRMSPAYQQYERDLAAYQQGIRDNPAQGPDMVDRMMGRSVGAAADRTAQNQERGRPMPPAPGRAPTFGEFKSGKVDGFAANTPSLLDEDGDGIDDRLQELDERNKLLEKQKRLEDAEKKNRQLERDRARREVVKRQQERQYANIHGASARGVQATPGAQPPSEF